MSKLRGGFLGCLFGLTGIVSAQVYVSTSGDDGQAGSVENPVRSISRGLELARKNSGEARSVRLVAGIYYDSAATLGPSDSNLVIESASSNDRAKLVGGSVLTGFEPDGDRFWSAPLPKGREWDVRLLEVNGRFCPRARFPETGTLTHLSSFTVPWMSTTGGGWKRPPTTEELTTLKYRANDIPQGIDIHNAEVTVFHMWDESVSGIARQNIASNTFTLSPPLGHPPGAFDVKTYCLWNIREGMTQPGQWYFDRTRGRIVYWPLPGEDMKQAKVVIPTQRVILAINGATNVVVRNLDLAITTVPLITGGFAAGAFDGAIQAANTHDVTFENLRVSNVAGQAIKTAGAVNHLRVENCDIAMCGAGGVYLHGASNVVANTLIHDVGLMFPSAMGIEGGGQGCTLSHNEIHDTPYSAIDFSGEQVVIEHNLLYRCMKVLHDGAAIYTFASRKSVIRNNVAREIVDTGGYGASAYYLDERSRDCVVENNLSLDVARPSHNHMATNNTIRGNVFINHGDLHLTFPRCTGFVLQSNVLYATGKITVEGVNHIATWTNNLMHSGTGVLESFETKDYANGDKQSGICEDTRNQDPRFVSLESLDLRYEPGSPAAKLGLPPLAIGQAGRVATRR